MGERGAALDLSAPRRRCRSCSSACRAPARRRRPRKLARHLKLEREAPPVPRARRRLASGRDRAAEDARRSRSAARCTRRRSERNPVQICARRASTAAKNAAATTTVIFDTAGRLAHRRGADGGARSHPRRGVAARRSCFVADAMTGQDAVNVATGFHERLRYRRRDPHQDRRRRARRRGALDPRRHRGADRVRRRGREARRARAVPSRPHGVAHPRHGRRAVADRARRDGLRSEGGREAREEAPQATSSRSRTSATSCGR